MAPVNRYALALLLGIALVSVASASGEPALAIVGGMLTAASLAGLSPRDAPQRLPGPAPRRPRPRHRTRPRRVQP